SNQMHIFVGKHNLTTLSREIARNVEGNPQTSSMITHEDFSSLGAITRGAMLLSAGCRFSITRESRAGQ
ncbi:hypothetical protein, partial [Desulfovibrio sp.]|uniref:hypothetical protein n=1 Tax=Desulfovibrio sp. TaxID=885 RepID=UPI003076A530